MAAILRWMDTRGAQRLTQALALFCVASVAVLYYSDRQQADCLRRYNEQAAAVNRERSEATSADWAAMDRLVEQLLSGQPFRSEAQHYLDTRAGSLKKRADNPLTPPPSDYCS